MKSLLSNTRRPDITFHTSGRIDITARLVHILGIHQGDVIDIATDGNEYLLYIRHNGSEVTGRHEAQCYPTNAAGKNFRCYSKRLCEAVVDAIRHDSPGNTAVGPTGNAVRLPAGAPLFSRTIGKDAIPLITRNPL